MSGAADDASDLYQAVVLRHGRNPVHQRRLDPHDAAARGENPMCGDRVEVRLRLDPAGAVAEAAFEARGCAISVASADLMAEAAAGRTPGELRDLARAFDAMTRTGECPDCLGELRALSGVHDYPSRRRCATLPWTALVQALDEAAPGTARTTEEAAHG
ncbi:MAG: Fe-S cluster assembly sulfur transfer protein SufU [Janthinobacterium lividum]